MQNNILYNNIAILEKKNFYLSLTDKFYKPLINLIYNEALNGKFIFFYKFNKIDFISKNYNFGTPKQVIINWLKCLTKDNHVYLNGYNSLNNIDFKLLSHNSYLIRFSWFNKNIISQLSI